VFYVSIVPAGGRTQIRAVGKPPANGKEVCTDRDQDEAFDPCEDVFAGVNWNGRVRMTGREENETIRSVLLELEDARPPSDVPTPTTKL
jgi:hypothetical protein